MNLAGWKTKLAALGLSTTALVFAALGLAALVGECGSFRQQAKSAAAVVVAAPTRVEEKATPITLPCRDVQAIDPKPKDREKLAEKYHRPDLFTQHEREALLNNRAPAAEILGERILPPMPAGGTALLTLEPDVRVELTVAPNPEKLFEWRSVYEMGALYGVGTSSGTGDTRGRAWGAVEPLRFGRVHLRLEAGVDLRAGQTDGYAMAGAVWRSR